MSYIVVYNFYLGRYSKGSHSNAMTKPRPDISLFFPVYNDEHTVRVVANRALELLEEVADNYEIIMAHQIRPVLLRTNWLRNTIKLLRYIIPKIRAMALR